MPQQNKPAPDFIPYTPSAVPDFIPAGQQAQPAPEEKPGFLQSLGESLGFSPAAEQEREQHPIRSAFTSYPPVAVGMGLYQGAKRTGGELLEGAKSAMHGNMADAGLHAISSIPVVGPTMMRASEQAPTPRRGESYWSQVKDAATDPGTMGTLFGGAIQTAPAFLGAADAAMSERPLFGQLPSTSRAGKVFASISKDAKDVPISFEKTTPELERFTELTQRGGRNSKPFTQLSKRLNPENETGPVNFPEGRDFYSNVSDAAHQTPLQKIMGRGMKPTMRRQAVNVRRAFNEDLTNAADQVGRGQDYTDAMKEYANAKRLQKVAKGAALLGAGEAARRTGLLGNWIHRTALQQ